MIPPPVAVVSSRPSQHPYSASRLHFRWILFRSLGRTLNRRDSNLELSLTKRIRWFCSWTKSNRKRRSRKHFVGLTTKSFVFACFRGLSIICPNGLNYWRLFVVYVNLWFDLPEVDDSQPETACERLARGYRWVTLKACPNISVVTTYLHCYTDVYNSLQHLLLSKRNTPAFLWSDPDRRCHKFGLIEYPFPSRYLIYDRLFPIQKVEKLSHFRQHRAFD